MNDLETRRHRQAYYASASFADAQVGKVMAALEASGLADDTVIALFGDHGWHLGENNEWAKHTAMDRANKAPLLFSTPATRAATRGDVDVAGADGSGGGGGGQGRMVSEFAELVDGK